VLNILDELVLQGSIKQDIITVVGVYQGGRESEDENEAQGQDNIPVETKKKGSKYKTIINYQTEIKEKLPLGIYY
jgi:hypothetical protein